MADFSNAMGALWEKTSAKGVKFYSGEVTVHGEKIPIVVFTNRQRPGGNDPDFRIFKSEPRSGEAQPPQQQGNRPTADDWGDR